MMDISKFDSHMDLILEKEVPLAPEEIWRAWTDPEIIPLWFAPKPWSAHSCKLDLRPGGVFQIVMQSPEKTEMPCNGCYLEVRENEKLVWTDALLENYRPAKNPFFTGMIMMEKLSSGAKYTAVARHKDEETKKQHEEMGFHDGWGICLQQLVEVMQSKR